MSILFLVPRVPFPLESGSPIRTFHLLRGLSRRFRVHALIFVDDEREAAAASELRLKVEAHVELVPRSTNAAAVLRDLVQGLIGPAPYSQRKYARHAMAQALRRVLAAERPRLVHCDHLHMGRYGLMAMRESGVVFSIDEHNIESQILARLASQSRLGNGLSFSRKLPAPARRVLAAAIRWQAELLRRYEADLADRAWGITVCSPQDQQMLASLSANRNVRVVPNGVEVGRAPSQPLQAGHLIFIGSLDWAPNEDAAIWFATEILPVVRRTRPDLALHVVGRRPSPQVQALARIKGVQVTGRVPEVGPHLAGALCLVVPLRVGGGTRLKILEAFAAGVPVVSTRIGCEGIACVPDEHLLLAETPAEFAAQIRRLAGDAQLRSRLVTSAARLARERYDWDAIAGSLARFYEELPEPGR